MHFSTIVQSYSSIIDTGLLHYHLTVALQYTTVRMNPYEVPQVTLILLVQCLAVVASSVIIIVGFCQRSSLDKLVHTVLRWIILKPWHDTKDDEPQSLLYGFLIPRCSVYLLAIYFVVMLSEAGIVFCDMLLECDNISNNTLTCNKYNLDIGKAAGTAGGMITIAMLIIKVITGIFLFLKQCEPNVDHHSCNNCCRRMLICLTLTCQALILIAFIVMLSVPKFRNRLTLPIQVQYINILGVIFVAVAVPCFDFRKLDKQDDDKEEPSLKKQFP